MRGRVRREEKKVETEADREWRELYSTSASSLPGLFAPRPSAGKPTLALAFSNQRDSDETKKKTVNRKRCRDPAVSDCEAREINCYSRFEILSTHSLILCFTFTQSALTAFKSRAKTFVPETGA